MRNKQSNGQKKKADPAFFFWPLDCLLYQPFSFGHWIVCYTNVQKKKAGITNNPMAKRKRPI
jgi:hypothetical protein